MQLHSVVLYTLVKLIALSTGTPQSSLFFLKRKHVFCESFGTSQPRMFGFGRKSLEFSFQMSLAFQVFHGQKIWLKSSRHGGLLVNHLG